MGNKDLIAYCGLYCGLAVVKTFIEGNIYRQLCPLALMHGDRATAICNLQG